MMTGVGKHKKIRLECENVKERSLKHFLRYFFYTYFKHVLKFFLYKTCFFLFSTSF